MQGFGGSITASGATPDIVFVGFFNFFGFFMIGLEFLGLNV